MRTAACTRHRPGIDETRLGVRATAVQNGGILVPARLAQAPIVPWPG